MSFTKINVAVAGVTNGLGHAIATELIANPSVNTVTLLTRASPSSPVPEVLKPLVKQGAIFQPVDYSSVEDITKVLQDVHAVISTMFTPSDITPAINLIDSAKAAGVKRFAPSEMAFSKEANYIIEDYKSKLTIWEKVKESGMECTAFRCGMFMDFFAMGSDLYKGPVRMYPIVVNTEERKAEIPGSGDYKMTFTALADIGKFVSAAITLEHWPEELSMAGETLTYNEVVRMAEEAIGEKFSVTYFSLEDLKKRHDESVEKKDEVTQRLMDSYTAFAKGMGEIKDPYLNKVTDVQPTNIADFLKKYWSKV